MFSQRLLVVGFYLVQGDELFGLSAFCKMPGLLVFGEYIYIFQPREFLLGVQQYLSVHFATDFEQNAALQFKDSMGLHYGCRYNALLFALRVLVYSATSW